MIAVNSNEKYIEYMQVGLPPPDKTGAARCLYRHGTGMTIILHRAVPFRAPDGDGTVPAWSPLMSYEFLKKIVRPPPDSSKRRPRAVRRWDDAPPTGVRLS